MTIARWTAAPVPSAPRHDVVIDDAWLIAGSPGAPLGGWHAETSVHPVISLLCARRIDRKWREHAVLRHPVGHTEAFS